ncbi:MAG: acetate--CoA ligase family protein [Thermoplasmata archaeon]|nr:MAG: acetate--CoA ligase family protein [Thermoplasmata archaeon]
MVRQNKKILEILDSVRSEKRFELTEIESKSILNFVSVPIIDTRLADDAEAAVRFASAFEYPVVLKIASPDILHKFDAKGVATNLTNEEEVEKSFKELLRNAKKYNAHARIWGVTVQKHIPRGIEVIVGAVRDPIFGPAVMFGMGGIWIELMKDVSFRLAPTTKESALEMISEIQGYPLLQRFRGGEHVNLEVIAEIIVKISKLISTYPEISEIDVNPIFARADDAIAVDARIVLRHD